MLLPDFLVTGLYGWRVIRYQIIRLPQYFLSRLSCYRNILATGLFLPILSDNFVIRLPVYMVYVKDKYYMNYVYITYDGISAHFNGRCSVI